MDPLLELLPVITLLVIFLISSVDTDSSPTLQSPYFCFRDNPQNLCVPSVEYPLEFATLSSNSCGYPGFEVYCKFGDDVKVFINISSHIYYVLEVDYRIKTIRLVDIDGERSRGGCPQPKQNFSFPSSPSWVSYHLSILNHSSITIYYNCSSVPAEAEEHLLCSKGDTNTPPSYAFYHDETREGFDWNRNCAQNVVVPVRFFSRRGSNYSDAIRSGFYMTWSATDWCEACERSGGRCWSNSTTTGCACSRSRKSYNKTCLAVTSLPPPPALTTRSSPPRGQGAPPTPSIALKSQHRKDGPSTGLKIGIGILSGIGAVLLVSLLVFCKRLNHSSLSIYHWQNKKKSPNNIEVFLEKYGCLARRYKYSEIRKMTNSFKDTLGQGGYGRVFKGELPDGRLVAVKQLNEPKGDGEDFINEVATIGRTNHVNVVNLVGFCIEGARRALVYEFMPNGSLERFIYTQKESATTMPLGWEKLYEIALGIAKGLEYLHLGCNTRILHFDIKPHNILLDQNFCPKISDFGLAKLYPLKESVVSTVGARGTMGYIAPELCYKSFGNVSHKSDVYSYGMMMLEMIGGRKNIDTTVDNISEIYFPLWIYNHLKQSYEAKGLEEIQVREVFEDEKAKKMILVALWCVQAHPVDRPSMSKVVEMLEGNIHELQMPPNPSVDPRSSSSTSL